MVDTIEKKEPFPNDYAPVAPYYATIDCSVVPGFDAFQNELREYILQSFGIPKRVFEGK